MANSAIPLKRSLPNGTRRLPVLTYHSIDDSGSVISISPHLFRTQMEYLKAHGWRGLTLGQMHSGYTGGEWPARTCLLTFDDGLANFGEHALPVLTACGFTATVFIATDWVGKTNDWPGQPNWVPRQALMDWNALCGIIAAGMEIGAHSLSHSHLTTLSFSEGERQVIQCQRVIEDKTGYRVRGFAYPYGESNRELEYVVGRYYDTGFGTRLGFATPASRRSSFERLDMFYLQPPRFFRALESGWLNSYLTVRHWVRCLRDLTRSRWEGKAE